MERGSIFGVEQDEQLIAKQAEILALRQMTDTLKTISTELVQHRELLGDMRTDIAVMKEQNKSMEDMRETQQKQDARLLVLEQRQQQWDGANNAVKWLREFGPWIVSLFVLAWGLFERSPK